MKKKSHDTDRPEIILREWFSLNEDPEGKLYAHPATIILANSAGWLRLAEICAEMAKYQGRSEHAHEHLRPNSYGFNQELSDEIEWILVPLTPGNREAAFKYNGISVATRSHGDLVPRMERLIRVAGQYVARHSRGAEKPRDE